MVDIPEARSIVVGVEDSILKKAVDELTNAILCFDGRKPVSVDLKDIVGGLLSGIRMGVISRIEEAVKNKGWDVEIDGDVVSLIPSNKVGMTKP